MGPRYLNVCSLTLFMFYLLMVSTDTVINDKTLPLQDQFLPIDWESMCTVQDKGPNDVYFRCSVDSTNSGKWRLDILGDWISSANISYHFDIQCTDKSNVSFSATYKAKNLVDLKITGCYIVDYFADRAAGNFSHDIDDQLITLQLIDDVIMIDILDLMYSMMDIEHKPKDFVCGHEDTIVEIVTRNISYDTLDVEELTANKTLLSHFFDVVKDYCTDYRKMKYTCDYKKLQYIDYSIRSIRSNYDIDLMAQNSLYNELKVFRYSDAGFTSLNPQFQEWWKYFPKLEILDLSYNNISTLELGSMVGEWNTPILHMNLSHNNFTRITSDLIHELVRIKNLKVNLKGNPFHCGCSPEMEKVVDLFQNSEIWKNDGYSRYEDFRHLNCASPESAKGKPFISLTRSDMSCVMSSHIPIQL